MTVPFAQTVIPDFGRGDTCVRDNHTFCWGWVKDNWSDVLSPALTHHIVLTLTAIGIGFVIAMALALVALRFGWFERPVTLVTGILYTIPSLALFQILVPITGLTDSSAEIALVSYTLLILFRNTLLGLRGVPDEVLEAARGMGLSGRQLLWRVQLPLALPAIVAGLRIATVTVISLATIAAYISVQSLGTPIFAAIQSSVFKTEILAAGGLAIALALIADAALVLVQRLLTPWARAGRPS
ncbi:MAG: ABC transporter permease [Chloroflexota bacterium]